MSACELLGAAVAALLNVCAVTAPVAGGVEPRPEAALDTPGARLERPLHQRTDTTASPLPAPERDPNPVRNVPLPAVALMGLGLIGGMMISAAVKRRKQ